MDSLRITENGCGLRCSIFLDKDEYEWFLDTLDEFWWRRDSGRGLNIWRRKTTSYGYLLGRIEEGISGFNSAMQVKMIFFPDGLQGKGWWKLLDTALELANRPVKNPNHGPEKGRVSRSVHIEKASQPKEPW